MEAKLIELKTRLQDIDNLESAFKFLFWDQSVYMPPGGAAAHGRQIATLTRLAHEKFTEPVTGHLLDELEPYIKTLPEDSNEAALVRVTRRKYEKATKVPPDFLAKFYEHLSASETAWRGARAADNFSAVQPFLEKTLDFSRQYAGFFPGYDHIADPLIDEVDDGMRVSVLRPLFSKLREGLAPLVQAIAARPPVDDACLHQHFDGEKLLNFGSEIITRFGFDFSRGRIDKSPHPFSIMLSPGDVRITTRFQELGLIDTLFSIFHEAGHGVYYQGIQPSFEATPLAELTPLLGIHESQSLLWESIIGQSIRFWETFYPGLQAVFPEQLGQVPLENFYKAINKVQPSLIRANADEVTYNLHILTRFELELELLEGRLTVRDLPEAWHSRYESDLGVRAQNDRDGVLQDMHWYSGFIGGAFQSYTIGRLLSAQFYASALKAHPEIEAETRSGEFRTLHTWLKENIYQHGAKYTAAELIEKVTGGGIMLQPYLEYLWGKYKPLYGLD